MNANFEIEYLEGGQEFFGGEGTVYTVTREGYVDECPNVGQFLENLQFTLQMENEIMRRISDEGAEPDQAVANWLRENPDTVDAWLEGVTTTAGEPGLPAVKSALGI